MGVAHRQHEKCPQEKDRRILQRNFAYALAARRRINGGDDGDGGDGGDGGGFGASLHLCWLTYIFVCTFVYDCSHLVGGDFNAMIKHRLAECIKEINRKYDRLAASSASMAATTGVAGGRDADVGGYKIMRMALAIALMFVAGSFIVATATKGSKYPHFFKHRTKLREIRGFKPEYISTAIGFGKRDGPAETLSDVSGRDRDLSSILRNLSRM
ncbi:hypothetical protein ALC57_11005 [Trachymyrmex cornetzi]|uniref:Uncharacterized protein n=1 Tax=Trachymyrmex cornetzi TaxID=471704 RepID=A0A195DVA5_9HYME|nr:hypothetical protein ALC57_11005 [Trachymyrmex cornetzi]